MTIDLGRLLDVATKKAGDAQRGPVPARVTSYDRASQSCDAIPLVSPKGRDLPEVKSIPVAYPSGGGFSITWDLQSGDVVFLVPCESDVSAWHERGIEGAARTARRYNLSDVIAIPSLHSKAAPLSEVAAGALVLAGADIRLGSASASDFVALASKVLAELQNVQTWANTHTHTGVTPGPGITGTATPMPAPASVAASKVRAE